MQRLAEICIQRPVFALMLVLAITVVGAFSFFTLGVDRFPNVDLAIVTVTVQNTGASPAEIETEITDKLEEQVNTISGIDELRSSSIEGLSQIIVQFKLEKNGDVAAQEVRDKVNLVVNELPETAEAPIVQKFDANAAPVLQIAVSAPISLREVTDIADKDIKERIESIDGVGQVRLVGDAEREIEIFVNPERMRAYDVTATDVVSAVQRQNREIPGGRVDQGAQELTLRTMGRLTRAEEFNDIPIVTRGSYVVRLRDVANARDGAAEQRSLSRLNGQPAVTLSVIKQSGANTLEVAEAVKQRLAEIRPTLPAAVQMQIVSDQTVFIEAAVSSVEHHLIEGSIFACVIIFLFLWNVRLTLIAALAIPTSIIGTFGAMALLGYSLNQITLLALTLMVGIVIDDAIVVLENIYRLIEEEGMSPLQAAVEGTREVGLAVLATTLSLLAVFVPVGFMGGIVGRFMASFGLTASAAIAISLIVSFTLTPMLCALFIKARPTRWKKHARASDGDSGGHASGSWLYRKIDGTYTWMLEWSMRHRWVIVTTCVLVILSIIPLLMFIGGDFLPQEDESQFDVSVRAPEGSTLAATSTSVERIARDIRELPGVADTLTTVGGGEQQIVNTATIFVRLKPIEERERTQSDLITSVRELLAGYKDLRTSVQPIAAIGGSGGERTATVQYLITGPDIAKLTEYSERLKEKVAALPDAVDVDTSLVAGKPELRVHIDRERAAELGVAVEDVAQALNILVAGFKASTFNDGTDQFDVRVRATGQFRQSAEDLRRMTVRSDKEGMSAVTLDQVTRIERSAGPSSIDRFDRQRQVTLYANLQPGGSVSEVTSKIDEAVKELNFEPGYTPALTGDAKELNNTIYYFGIAFVLTFVFMYMVLAAQFESFIHPITILLTLPLAVPFGILSLLLTGQSMNIFTGLGLLVLFGIVKKNAILQVDHTNGLRARGMNRDDAIIKANRDRLRPILMTTVAFVAGMLPLVISTGVGAGTNRSIGILVAGGQTLCLLLTLLAVPVFYSLFDDLATLPLWKHFGIRYRWTLRGVTRRANEAWATMANAFTRRTRQDKHAEGISSGD